MNKSRKILTTVALCLIVAGLLTCTGVMAFLGFDFTKLDNSVYTENSYEFSDAIKDISIDAGTADIKILPSNSNSTKVVCFEDETDKHSISLHNGKLTITKNAKEWYEYISGFSFRSPDITLYLPQGTYDSANITVSTGDIALNDINVANIDIDSSTGNVTLTDTESYKVNIESSAGDIEFNNVTAHSADIEVSTGHVDINHTILSGDIEIETSTGDITFNLSDANSISAETSTGHITGTLLTAKSFFTDTSTGDVDVPRTTGSRCELETSTGDIKIRIAE